MCGLEHRDCDVHTHWLRADLWSALSISSTPAQVTQADPSSRQSRPSLGAVDSVASISGCAWKDHLKQIVCRSVPTGPAGDFTRKCTACSGHLCGQCIESTHSFKKATLLTPRSSRRKHRSDGGCLESAWSGSNKNNSGSHPPGSSGLHEIIKKPGAKWPVQEANEDSPQTENSRVQKDHYTVCRALLKNEECQDSRR